MLQQKTLLEKESEIVDYYENCIPFDFPIENIIKNFCIQSIVNKGIHRKVYGKLCEDICLTHGINFIATLTHLANLGLFYEAGSIKEPYPFVDLRKELKLIGEHPIDHTHPQDTSFAYGGYIPVV